MKFVACLIALSICTFSATFAEEPQTPAAPALSPTAPVANAAQTPAAEVKPAAPAVAASTDKSQIVDKAATDAEIKTMRARGYKPVNRNGMLVYCRAEGQLGTHFEKQRCSTMDELKSAELTGKEYVNSIQQQASSTPFLKDPGPGR
jgi:hypothetical protein